jgi:hypothetical protein
MYIGLHVKYLSILSDFNGTNFLDRFSKSLQISNFIKFRPVGAGLFYEDGKTHTTLIATSRTCLKIRAENFSGRKLERDREGHHRRLLNHVKEVF